MIGVIPLAPTEVRCVDPMHCNKGARHGHPEVIGQCDSAECARWLQRGRCFTNAGHGVRACDATCVAVIERASVTA